MIDLTPEPKLKPTWMWNKNRKLTAATTATKQLQGKHWHKVSLLPQWVRNNSQKFKYFIQNQIITLCSSSPQISQSHLTSLLLIRWLKCYEWFKKPELHTVPCNVGSKDQILTSIASLMLFLISWIFCFFSLWRTKQTRVGVSYFLTQKHKFRELSINNPSHRGKHNTYL